MKKLVKWDNIVLFFAGWKFPDYFIYGLTILISFIAGIIAKGYYQ